MFDAGLARRLTVPVGVIAWRCRMAGYSSGNPKRSPPEDRWAGIELFDIRSRRWR
jgi:hypothetical protein